jgi:L-asparaginase / beta-aspartyl-peptidase
MNNFAIAIHGGAGTIVRADMSADQEKQYRQALAAGLAAGHQVLAAGGPAMQAVEQAVISLEDNPLFNAGKGSVFNHEGKHEMDAAIMCGKTLTAGAVAGVSQVRNPIILAEHVRRYTPHVLLSGTGAEAFAREQGLAIEDPIYFYHEYRFQQWMQAQQDNVVQLDHAGGRKFGTVGAVARDMAGNLAAATSTGGMTNKKYNRIGDSPLIGVGTYANNQTCAISCTGHGEFFMRAVVAYDISCLMEYKGWSLRQACEYVVQGKLVELGGEGGLIAIDAQGNMELPFNSEGMYRAAQRDHEPPFIGIYK